MTIDLHQKHVEVLSPWKLLKPTLSHHCEILAFNLNWSSLIFCILLWCSLSCQRTATLTIWFFLMLRNIPIFYLIHKEAIVLLPPVPVSDSYIIILLCCPWCLMKWTGRCCSPSSLHGTVQFLLNQQYISSMDHPWQCDMTWRTFSICGILCDQLLLKKITGGEDDF